MAEIMLLLKEVLEPSNKISDEQPDTTDMPELDSERSAAERRNRQGLGPKIQKFKNQKLKIMSI